ncbi:uncharacterized protein RHOBADRAFT_50448 [Rhodotorula graminis WP1]|uniref:Uncharacterized protein n=1 Tax=Rhodotorula graminis (strain WP1) TaxID=578459 RepID=A0A194SBU5_RHOGW|nr:uncharacterized protein RHOBADRAFT_50448 [Rhodotorula graminis WP1]KPV77920.1 hypothetical protein RHOBADRAFT_50448 [Rhodotorula graminis WP1]
MPPPPSASSPASPPTPPRSRSTSSLHTILLSPPRPSQAAPHSSSFAFSSLAGVWSSLKAAATVEIAGFVRGLSGTGGGAARAGGDVGSRGDEARVGEKRERAGEGSGSGRSRDGERRGKRRRVVESRGDDLLFDGVPPLMPPISQSSAFPSSHSYDSLSSSPRQNRNLSTSPSSPRHPLRPYVDSSYADELVHAATTDEGLSSSFAPRASLEASRRSGDGSGLRSLSGKRRIAPAGLQAPAAPGSSAASSTSALAAHRLHRRERSYAQAGLQHDFHPGPTLPQLATLSASASLPNLAASGASSPQTQRKGKDKMREGGRAGATLLAEAGDQFERVWRTEKEKERSNRRIEELEEEVQRLKGQLSAQKAPAFARMPRVSAPLPPPPPPAPPPPPVGKPHPLLANARASLRATPERAKRLHSTLGGIGAGPSIDMSACLSELGAKRDKLRKVGLPSSRTQDDLRRAASGGTSTSGELGDVLSRAFQRKFANTAGAPSPTTPRVASGSALRVATAPEWSPLVLSASRSSAGDSTLSASQSVPGDLSALALPRSRSLRRPERDFGTSSIHASSSGPALHGPAAVRAADRPSGSDLALDHDDPAASRPRPHVPTSTGMSPSLSSASLPSAPPEPAAPAAASTRAGGPASMSTSGSPRDKLPGLEFGRSRPVTPARRRAREQRERASAEKAQVLVDAEDDEMLEEDGDGVVRVDFGSGSEDECEGMEELVGCGERRADPTRVFGRA